ncbi:gas vesicle protein [Flavobacterium sp. 103]|uniref:YtxH domain-containing protein n=1 Tax=unclassified Flavobacterium TaxID=196869 RepID=UPI000D5E1670|nr:MULTISPECIES: YtxH domain-containing protein [unclassified Flavobacterium]PVX47874.1 gas vesicle protein [Flavobacterium sp. 103]QKJ63630.1 YtxH domain-containing protein [Flavobacterium sp. M31R6]
MKANKIALGLLGGIAAGAVVGILFAPAKGADTRKKIQQKGSDYADNLKDKLENLSGSLKNNYEKIVHNGKDLVAESRSKFDDIKSINP